MSDHAPETPQNHWLSRPLAIVGMACRLPGADGLDAFWQMLASGGCAIERMSDSKLNRRLYFHPEKGQRGKTYTEIGGFVAERELDWNLLGLTPEAARDWDPCHLNFCEVAARACQHAGYDPLNLKYRNAGVYVGHSGGSTLGGELAYRTLSQDYVHLLDDLSSWPSVAQQLTQNGFSPQDVHAELLRRIRSVRPERVGGKPYVDAGFAAAIVTHTLGLTGPHMSIDAACASSLVALALGASSLHAGETDMAIIGGASFNKSDSLILFSNAQSCSATATRPFDEAADGLIGSEGYVAIVLKTYDRAIDDGDTIQAVIRGIGFSSDGRGRSLWAPRKEGQVEAIRRAYSDEVTPDSVQMIEAHATSTQVGDATEMEALSSFYQPYCGSGKRLPVGSVKSNIGHTLETAGLAGLVKSVLAIQHATIPPSVNIQKLSSSIPWSDIPLYVPRTSESWPPTSLGQPRRAAVNAFGIGGLNVHVVVDQHLPGLALTNSSGTGSNATDFATSVSRVGKRNYASPSGEPIAIVGRGIVLPGALHMDAFREFLQSPSSQKSMPTRDRSSDRAAAFMTDFNYDWRRHKVPPKQISQANPLQFMLLDAAEQALREAKLLERDFDRRHTAVVVGSAFGGDFGNALFAGLRLPEFRDHLESILRERGIAPEDAAGLVNEYETHFLNIFPALVDETGSFTSSTLASRLSKTFDLMGGAMAIDAGNTSGLAAVNAACQLLRGGTVSQVLCAAAQRALDRAAMENLDQLRRIGEESVGEGVGLVLLKRWSDAKRDGDQVFGLITDTAVGFDARSLQQSMHTAKERLGALHTTPSKVVGGLRLSEFDQAVEAGLPRNLSFRESPTLKSLGHLQAAQGIVDLVASTVDRDDQSQLIAGHALGGQSYLMATCSAEHAEKRETENNETVNREGAKRDDATLPSIALPTSSLASTDGIAMHCFEAASMAELVTMLANPTAHSKREYTVSRNWRAGIVSRPEDLSAKANVLASQLGNAASSLPLAEQGIFWVSPEHLVEQAKIAFLFPGQGSQSNGMLRDLIESDEVARHALQEANKALADLGEPSFQEIAWSENNLLGESVWQTQAAVLVADWILFNTLAARGIKPVLVTGHSFGEFPAMLAAGCWDFQAALKATWHRCQAITHHVPAGCAMLSIHLDGPATQQLIDQSHLAVCISHLNAPQQTVVGGKQAAVAQFAALLEEEGVHSRLLPVPTAFHTPALDAAVMPFRRALEQITIGAPQTTLLSSVTNRRATTPDAMRNALAQQLVSRLDFIGVVRELAAEGITLAVEVGPGQVMSRLVRQIDPAMRVVATDNGKRGVSFQLKCAEALVALHQLDRKFSQAAPSNLNTQPASVATMSSITHPLHFDATQNRRERLRRVAEQQETLRAKPPAATPAVHFDATDTRRHAMRSLAAGSGVDTVAETQKVSPANTLAVPQVVQLHAETPEEAKSESIAKFLIDFVVEQTGYPAEIIELDWDIEADLGIDSIKKAQLFGELREFFDLESHKHLKLDSFRTLRDIVVLLEQTPGKADWLGQSKTNDAAAASGSVAGITALVSEQLLSSQGQAQQLAAQRLPGLESQQSVTPSGNDSSSVSRNRHDLQKFLVDFVVEQTGYPPEIVEMEADLEADLGIDSIKKAQLFGELREMFDFQPTPDNDNKSRAGLSQFRTLADVLDVLAGHGNEAILTNATQIAPVTNARSMDDDAARNDGLQDTVDVAPNEALTSAFSDAAIAQPGAGNRSPIPRARFFENQFVVDSAFKAAAAQSLAALASRGDVSSQIIAPSLQNGNATWFESRVVDIALAVGAIDKSVSALDRALQVQSSWRRLEAAASSIASDGSTNTSDICWLVELLLPKWLTAVDIAAGELVYGQTTFLGIPGGVTTTAQVIDDRLLRVVGLAKPSETNATSLVKLTKHLHAQQPQSLDEAVTLARGLKLPDDWWMLLVDAKSHQQVFIESSNGTLVIEKGRLPQGKGASPVSSIAIGLDRSSHRFVMCPHAPYAINGPIFENEPARETPSPAETNDEAKPCAVEDSDLPSDTVASRYILRMVPSPLRDARGRQPRWTGAALIVGDNAIARQLEARLRSVGVETIRWASSDDPHYLANAFEKISKERAIPHLFITTPCDADAAVSLDEEGWRSRRNRGVMGNFWLCQKWNSHIFDTQLAGEATVVLVSSLGGDFGIGRQLRSTEGGLAGLLKSMLIENWMQGQRTLGVKVIDAHPNSSPAEIVGNIWQELSNPNYQIEVAYPEGVRHSLRAIRQRVPARQHRIENRGTWVCTGGARGITAYVAEQLAARYDLQLHLLGITPEPNVDPRWRNLDHEGTRRLKARVMTEARDAGKNAVKAWQDLEKSIEIDATLERLKSLGHTVHYHCCDVSDRKTVQRVLEEVRRISGPIQGILHGAGVGKDSRFDRKQADKVDQCIAAKVDGALALIEATLGDPLKYFVGFGSISGRFGANGHADYSLANEMLCKQIDYLKQLRPDLTAVGFHWHAWGDVGMATKPETRLALEMIDMQFMPAKEGIEHLIQELESGAGESEVLITDERYYRMYYPMETLPARASDLLNKPLLQEEVQPQCGGDRAFLSYVDPTKDAFLTDHLLDGRPLLPYVIAAEMLMEAACEQLQANAVVLKNVEATGAVRFFHDAKQKLRLETRSSTAEHTTVDLFSDFTARDGRLVEANRKNFRAEAVARDLAKPQREIRIELPSHPQWTRAKYPDVDNKFFVGWPLQRLQRVTLVPDGLVGQISAPALIELAGPLRDVRGWRLPCSAMDACLFATGILAWQQIAAGTALPVRFGQLSVGRLPSPGEVCEVHVRFKSVSSAAAFFDFTLYGIDRSVLLNATDYKVAWLATETPTAMQTRGVERGAKQ